MSAAKRHPLAALIGFVVLGTLLGSVVSMYFARREEQELLKQLGGNPSRYDIGDGGLLYLLLGVSVGFVVGLAVGIVRYIIVKRAESEAHLGLNLSEKSTVK
jgi:uncharacterized protein YneF (UPF0154 family)